MPAFSDGDFSLFCNSDYTKQGLFDLSGLLTGAIQTVKWPSFVLGTSTASMATLELPQTWSGLNIFDSTGTSSRVEFSCDGLNPDEFITLLDTSGTTYMDFIMPHLSGARKYLTFPSDSGTLALISDIDVARTWATLQTFKDTCFKIVDDGDATKTCVFSLGGATANADLTLAWAGTVDATLTLPAATGLLPLVGNSASPATSGLIAKVDLTGQHADIAETILVNGGPVGDYLITAEIYATAVDAAYEEAIVCTISWTDEQTNSADKTAFVQCYKDAFANAPYVAGVGLSVPNQHRFAIPIHVSSGNVTWNVTGDSGDYGDCRYVLHLRAIYLG